MTIKCYLFIGVAKQLNHTYYTLGENKWAKFYYNLIDGINDENEEDFRFRPFVYEVELDSEDVFNISYYYLEAIKFKVTRVVDFSEIVKVSELSSRTRNEINSILSGIADSKEVIQQYRKSFTKEYSDLSKVERYKFLAIVSQKHYELPLITISRYRHINYVRLLEFYNRPHNTYFVGFASSLLERYNREKLYGSREFENLTDVTMNEISKNYNLRLLLQTRQLPQERFEEYCEYMLEEKGSIYHVDECVGAGYEVLPKYKEQFYPYTIYSNTELALDLIDADEVQSKSVISKFLLKNGYKIRNLDYNDEKFVSIIKAREIFSKNEYKYIELKGLNL